MTTIEQSIDVAVPVRTAFDQWTRFEDFPRFMEGVDRIEQVTDTRTHWETSIAGIKRTFEAELTERHPGERIAWHSIGVPRQEGTLTFHSIGPGRTRMVLRMQYDPKGVVEKAGDRLHLVERRVKGNMSRFKHFLESRGAHAWGRPR